MDTSSLPKFGESIGKGGKRLTSQPCAGLVALVVSMVGRLDLSTMLTISATILHFSENIDLR